LDSIPNLLRNFLAREMFQVTPLVESTELPGLAMLDGAWCGAQFPTFVRSAVALSVLSHSGDFGYLPPPVLKDFCAVSGPALDLYFLFFPTHTF